MLDASPVVRRSRKDSAVARRQQILDSACLLIFERGYDPVSLADIGAAAGVSGPAIYRHFESKADILSVLCGQTIDRLIEFVGPRRADPQEELVALIEGQVRLVMARPELVRVFEDEQRSLPEALRRLVRRREREHAQRWVDALRALRPGVRVEQLEMLAFATVGMILSAPRWPRGLRDHPQRSAVLLAAAFRMLEIEGATAQPSQRLSNVGG